MVSTRGGARTGTNEIAPADEIALRKKPVRKAAAKPTAKPTTKATTKTTAKTATNTKAAPKTRATRSKRSEFESAPESGEDQVDELDREEPAETIKPVRKTTSRSKKEDEPTKAAPIKKARSTISRTTASRNAALGPLEDDTPALPPPTKPTATRATRATASKSKAPPLSPKKVTQVAQALPRTTRNAKAVPLKPAKAAVAANKPATRRRNVSDENAGVAIGNSVVEGAMPGPKIATTPSRVPKKRQAPQIIEDEPPMSSRPTTPADSLPGDLDDGVNDEAQEAEETESEAEDQEVSADELFGPKTPMKRVSPREGSKFISAQRSSRHDEAAMKTPVRRFAVLGTQRGTPQTQKPYCKPIVPSSEVRPMTVARARDRAMVFPSLQPLPVAHESDAEMEAEKEQSDAEQAQLPDVDETELIFVDDAVDQLRNNAPMEQGADGMTRPDESSADNSQIDDEGQNDITLDFDNDDVVQSIQNTIDEPVIRFDMEALRSEMSNESAEAEFESEEANAHDPNETLVEDEHMESLVEEHNDISETSDNSIIITRQAAMEDESMFDDSMIDDSMEEFRLPTKTPRPETIVWQNLRQDITIPFNFDGEVSPCRALPQAEPTELLTINHLAAGATAEGSGRDVGLIDVLEDVAAAQVAGQSTIRRSLDATVNLSDFIDVSFLAERQQGTPTPAIGNAEQATGEASDCAQNGETAPDLMDFELPSTPSHEPFPALADVSDPIVSQDTPHYALPTIATRRKSLPVINYRTPIKSSARHQTAGGASMPRILKPFNVRIQQGPADHTATPVQSRSSSAQGGSVSRSRTPFMSRPTAVTPRLSVPRASASTPPWNTPDRGLTGSPSPARSILAIRRSPSKSAMTGSTDAAQTSTERFPGLPPRATYEELAGPLLASLANTPAARTPKSVSIRTERFLGLSSASAYEEIPGKNADQSPSPIASPSTPQVDVKERYPGLPHRRTYEEHAKTAMPPTRFRTPTTHQAKRPATTRKPTSLRKIALKAAGSHTPVRTPLKAAAMTPGQIPCTPHPGVPLKGVYAFVEVFLSDGSCATTTYISVLQALGAKTTKTFNTDRVTHVVYKEGSPTTLQRIRHHNKEVEQTGVGSMIHCVNGRWVNDCKQFGKHMDETEEAYVVELDDMPASKRRRKSMVPSSLINIGGNVVRDRKSSSSLSRNTMMKLASSPKEASPSTPPVGAAPADKENSGDDSFASQDSPETPTYLAAPENLVQQTAPANRVKKLDLQAGDMKSRRLTFWNGGA